MEPCNHRDACAHCNKLTSELEREIVSMTVGNAVSTPIPRPDQFLYIYCYDPAGGEYIWQTGQIMATEEEAIAHALTMGNVFKIRIVRLRGLEKYETPDTLKALSSSDGEFVEYDTDQKDDGEDSPD